MSPLKVLARWLEEERASGVKFPNGAVLGTVSSSGQVRTRMLGVHLDDEGRPRFHTTPGSRKVLDLEHNKRASLTFAFQSSLRSVSLEGEIVALTEIELSSDWLSLDSTFRRSYLIFGATSGQPISSPSELVSARQALPEDAELSMPASFIGFRFHLVERVDFYVVGQGYFAEHTTHSYNNQNHTWSSQTVVP
ncbi:pyridoxamine 5'-phosphate oxidase family protein (plasmid) [Synechocystis sp. PCC 7339]|uniref:pyridoxamine 5'-phosphate oxidase family protein n=1 Tax=Synechocystis sp. PCC 7339 TaxID=2782213 RepID=UPI001CBFD4E2|nr:pyridoxamine 5'-phosphate oxidase family protein [Synechocystis sp. PCC 7339]UAJ74555.1 pyridoxamine 5'-phosphate oxidase family protein [Synechocystis sp. PCC 7339]